MQICAPSGSSAVTYYLGDPNGAGGEGSTITSLDLTPSFSGGVVKGFIDTTNKNYLVLIAGASSSVLTKISYTSTTATKTQTCTFAYTVGCAVIYNNQIFILRQLNGNGAISSTIYSVSPSCTLTTVASVVSDQIFSTGTCVTLSSSLFFIGADVYGAAELRLNQLSLTTAAISKNAVGGSTYYDNSPFRGLSALGKVLFISCASSGQSTAATWNLFTPTPLAKTVTSSGGACQNEQSWGVDSSNPPLLADFYGRSVYNTSGFRLDITPNFLCNNGADVGCNCIRWSLHSYSTCSHCNF